MVSVCCCCHLCSWDLIWFYKQNRTQDKALECSCVMNHWCRAAGVKSRYHIEEATVTNVEWVFFLPRSPCRPHTQSLLVPPQGWGLTGWRGSLGWVVCWASERLSCWEEMEGKVLEPWGRLRPPHPPGEPCKLLVEEKIKQVGFSSTSWSFNALTITLLPWNGLFKLYSICKICQYVVLWSISRMSLSIKKIHHWIDLENLCQKKTDHFLVGILGS